MKTGKWFLWPSVETLRNPILVGPSQRPLENWGPCFVGRGHDREVLRRGSLIKTPLAFCCMVITEPVTGLPAGVLCYPTSRCTLLSECGHSRIGSHRLCIRNTWSVIWWHTAFAFCGSNSGSIPDAPRVEISVTNETGCHGAFYGRNTQQR